MSRDQDRFIRSGPKRPVPEHGIKVKKAGLTWWGSRWIEALQRMAPDYAARLERGRSYARAGRVHDLVVDAGRVTAHVTGTRPKPYAVSLVLTQLTAATWDAAIAHMAEQAQFSAELLGGQMPRAIDDAFTAAGASVFPEHTRDLATECSCPDWANPCKHVAATHYVLGEALDRDPFLLFELRGRAKAEVLSALRAARGGDRSPAAAEADALERSIVGLALERPPGEDYDAPRAPLPSLALHFDEPAAHAAVLRQLGKPLAWSSDGSPAELLAPLIAAAAERARAIAVAETEAPPAVPEVETSEPPKAHGTRATRKAAQRTPRARKRR